jgi:hypothetical protein
VFPSGGEAGVGGLGIAVRQKETLIQILGMGGGMGGPGVCRSPIVPDPGDDLKLEYRR